MAFNNYMETIINGVKAWVNGLPKPNWNQNDPSAPDYIKGRTHWVDTSAEAALLEKNIIECFEDVDWGQTKQGYILDVSLFNFEVGNLYIVVFDGIRYECTAMLDGEYGNIVLGNGAFVADVNEDNNMNFAIGIYEDGSTEGYIISSESGTHTVGIYCMAEEVHKIDAKYLPDLPNGAYVGNAGVGYNAEVFNGNNPENLYAIMDGKPIGTTFSEKDYE